MEYLKRELVGGLSLIVGTAALAGTSFKFTPLVLALLSFGALWTVVVVGHLLVSHASVAHAPRPLPAKETRERPPRPSAAERVAHDILTDDFGRPTLAELKKALKDARREGKELLALIRYSLKNPYGGKMDSELQADFMKWAGGWPIQLNEYAPALYNVFQKRGIDQSRGPIILTIYDLEVETKHSLKMLATVRRHLWWESVLRRLGLR